MINEVTSSPKKLIRNNASLHSEDKRVLISLLLLQTLVSSESCLNMDHAIHIPSQPTFLTSCR